MDGRFFCAFFVANNEVSDAANLYRIRRDIVLIKRAAIAAKPL